MPLSDGAGEVVATGTKVTRFKKGDRVASIFFQQWLEGRPKPEHFATALGGAIDGMLSQYVTLNENGLVADTQAPELRGSGHAALRRRHRLECARDPRSHAAGRFRAAAGHGWRFDSRTAAFALRWGARPVITSSSDEKLARAKQLGAVTLINYKTTPEWDKAVLEATGGGVQQALEVGGKQTLGKTLASLASGGHVALIGGLSEFGGDIPAYALMGRNATASGLYVGSRADFEALNAFLDKHRFKPDIDKVFEFENAAAAYEYMDSGALFGKVVIRL